MLKRNLTFSHSTPFLSSGWKYDESFVPDIVPLRSLDEENMS